MTADGYSVIIPTYQRAGVLGDAVRSVLAQCGPDLELIVVDDGSTDGTDEYVGTFADDRLRLIRQRNRGRCRARNAGAAASAREWLVFLDSDDRLLPGALRTFDEGRRTGAELVVAPTVEERLDGSQSLADPLVDRRGFPWGLQAGGFAISRQLFERIDGYCPALEHSEHTEMALRLRSMDPLPVVAVAETATVVVLQRRARYDPVVQYEAATHLLAHASDELARDRHARAMQLGVAGEAARRLGRRREAVRTLARAVCDEPSLRAGGRLVRALVAPRPRRSMR